MMVFKSFNLRVIAAAAVALVGGAMAGQATTLNYQTIVFAGSGPVVGLTIDDNTASVLTFQLSTMSGSADLLGLGFDTGLSISPGDLAFVSSAPDTPQPLVLYGDGTGSQSACGPGCNFNGAGLSSFDYIVRLGENGSGPGDDIQSITFTIATGSSLANAMFGPFSVRAQSTKPGPTSIKFVLVPIHDVGPLPVPIPASGLLLIGGLGGLLALRRRRKTA